MKSSQHKVQTARSFLGGSVYSPLLFGCRSVEGRDAVVIGVPVRSLCRFEAPVSLALIPVLSRWT